MCELRSKSKLESSWRNTSRFQFWWCENNIETSTLFQNDPPSFASSFTPFLCHLVTHNREEEGVNRGSMWATGQTSNNSVINIRWWRCPLPSGSNLALLYPNSRLETHFILLLAKIIEYTVFQISFSHWFVYWNF